MPGRSAWGRWRCPAVLVAVGAMLLGTGLPALAFHEYSYGGENGAPSFTGVEESRADAFFTGIPSDGCSSSFTGTPVYQTMWVLFTSDAQNWAEEGTGHQCNDTYRYWYWGYGSQGVWYSQGNVRISGGANHVFGLYLSAGGYWSANVDVTQIGSFTHTGVGVDVEAGLESWAQGASSGGVLPNWGLAYTDYSGWINWSGNDYSYVSSPANEPMGGAWNGQMEWDAWETQSGPPCSVSGSGESPQKPC